MGTFGIMVIALRKRYNYKMNYFSAIGFTKTETMQQVLLSLNTPILWETLNPANASDYYCEIFQMIKFACKNTDTTHETKTNVKAIAIDDEMKIEIEKSISGLLDVHEDDV